MTAGAHMIAKADRVILVDKSDREVGTAEKLEVHETGRLHRAFSVFLLDARGRHLLQRRALTKYHSGGLWTNACCSHPLPGESVHDAARRRLEEELGIQTDAAPAFRMRYRAPMPNGLIEYEYDHVLIGHVDASVKDRLKPDADEVEDVAFLDDAEIDEYIRLRPESFTRWFRLAWPEVKRYLSSDGFHAARSVFCPDGAVATIIYPEDGTLRGSSDPAFRSI